MRDIKHFDDLGVDLAGWAKCSFRICARLLSPSQLLQHTSISSRVWNATLGFCVMRARQLLTSLCCGSRVAVAPSEGGQKSVKNSQVLLLNALFKTLNSVPV